jgi:hypothetical protein
LGLLAERAESTGVPLRPLDVKLEAEEMDRLLEQALGRIRLVDFERDALVERFDLRDAAASAVRRARRLFIARGIAVALDEVGLEAETDRKWLTFILDQLTVNAAKYASRTVVVRFQALGQALVVRIEDDGPGIHKEDLDRLGSRSFVGASGREADGAGLPSSGYGLYLAARAAEKLGVRLAFEERAAGGTAAVLTLPMPRGRFD